jgi:hypothetical protein
MSYTSIPNQPILFETLEEIESNCFCDPAEYKQIVDFNDDIYFQVQAPVCGVELDGTGSLGDEPNNWTYEDGEICSTFESDPDLQEGTFVWNFDPRTSSNIGFITFKVVVVVTSMTQGSISVFLSAGTSYTIYTAGTYEFYLSTNFFVNGNLSIDLFFTSISFVGCFNEPQVYAAGTGLAMAWVDESGEYVSDVTITDSSVISDKVTVHLAVQNQEIGTGCYRLAIADPCDNSCGQFGLVYPGFENDYGWDRSEGQWTIATSQATWTFAGDASSTMYNRTGLELCEGVSYNVTVDIASIADCAISVVAGTGSSCVPATVSTAGVHTFVLTVGTGDTTFGVKATATSIISASAVLNSVQAYPNPADIEYDLFSPILSVGNYDDPCTYLKLSACNTYNQFGFAFGESGFAPELRVEGLKRNPQYKVDADTFRFASGRSITAYADRLKSWSFHFGRLPEYLLDFLSIAFFFDNVNINGTKYFPADAEFPAIEWNDADNKLGRLDIELIEKNTKVQKVQCAAESTDCTPVPEPMIEDKLFQDTNPFIFQDGEYFGFN